MAKKSFSDASLSPAASKSLQQLGENIKRARQRRNMTQDELAARALMSVPRLRKIENGDPTVGLGAIAQILDIFELVEDLQKVAAPESDSLGNLLESRNTQRKRVSKPRKINSDKLDF